MFLIRIIPSESSENIADAYLTHLFTMHPFSTPLKTSENRQVFWCFHGIEKGCIGNRLVKKYWNSETDTWCLNLIKSDLAWQHIEVNFILVIYLLNLYHSNCFTFKIGIFSRQGEDIRLICLKACCYLRSCQSSLVPPTLTYSLCKATGVHIQLTQSPKK